MTGQEIVDWFDALFSNATTFASILASVLFSVTIVELDSDKTPALRRSNTVTDPGSLQPDRDTVKTLARKRSAIGAILFVFVVLLCQGFSLVLKFRGTWLADNFEGNRGVRAMFAGVSLIFQGLVPVGTMFFCLVIKAYVPQVGVVAFWITVGLAVVGFVIWVVQLCL